MNPDVYRAASTGNLSFFEKLTDPSSTLLQVTTEKNTVLHVALQFEQFHIVEELVRLRPSLVYEKNSKGNTSLHVAVRWAGTSSTVKLIIQNAKDQWDAEAGGQQLLSMVNEDGNTALQVAVRYDNDDEFEIVRELMKEDPKLAKHVNNAGESALFLAVDRENYKMARHILSAAPNDCSYAGRHGMNVLHALVLHTSCYINKRHFLSPKEIDTYGKATRFGRAVITLVWVTNLLFLIPLRESAARKYDIINRRLPRKFGTIPEDFVKEVMEKCPSTIEQGDDSGWTPLHIAAHMGNQEFVKLLLEKGNSPAYLRNEDGLSAFHIAAKEGNVEVMKELITKCPDIVELLDYRGRTAFHVAAESGIKQEAIRFLVRRPEFWGFFDEQDKEGNTLMHLEAINNPYSISFYLKNGRGIDLNVTDKEGFTAMDNGLLHYKLNLFTLPLWRKGARPSLRGALLKMGIKKLDPRGKQKLAGTGDGDGDGTLSNFVKQVSETTMLVATLIATVTFTAAFTVPGGFNQDGNVGEGLAVLSKITAFRVFLIANTLAFGLSTTSVFLHFLASATTGALFHKEVARRASLLINWSIGALLVAFIAGTYTVVPHSLGIAVVVIFCCCFLSAMFFPLSLDRF